MKTRTIEIYDVNELSEKAKDHALDHWRESQTEVFWAGELFESLKGLFGKCDGLKLKDYSLGECQSWLRVEFNREEAGELTGARALAWIENNLFFFCRIHYRAANRWELSKYGSYYRAGMIKPCPFTGYCADEDFIDALKKDVISGGTLKDAFEGLAHEYQRIYNAELENQNSMEYFLDHASANDFEFDIDGNLI